jgi:hypothetical protein
MLAILLHARRRQSSSLAWVLAFGLAACSNSPTQSYVYIPDAIADAAGLDLATAVTPEDASDDLPLDAAATPSDAAEDAAEWDAGTPGPETVATDVGPTGIDSAELDAAVDVALATDAKADAVDIADVNPGECSSDFDCDDGDPKTTDSCVIGVCSHAVWQPAVPCDAAHACPTGICNLTSHACVGCVGDGDCGALGYCVGGTCKYGAVCKGDADFCKAQGQVCGTAGLCVACATSADCGAGKGCVNQVCVAQKACATSKDCAVVCVKGTGLCGDCNADLDCVPGKWCTSDHRCVPALCATSACNGATFACQGGKTYATGVTCDDANACTKDACTAGTGCSHANLSAPCDDASACTKGDVCSGGTCAGAAIPCDDGNTCTGDSCAPSGGCVFTPLTSACNDANVCTAADTCGNGVCAGTPVNCDDQNPCTTDACDLTSGCTHTNTTDACDDGSACTVGDVCASGKCLSGVNACEDGNACTVDTCPGATCVHKDSSATCNDTNPCTDTGCSPTTGCWVTNNTAACSDKNPCTINDVCSSGGCVSGKAKVCDDGQACTADSCEWASGGCNNAVGGGCQLWGQACVANSDCAQGVCQSTYHVCVACATDGDCGPAAFCRESQCLAGIPCSADATCSGNGQVCDVAQGVCVDCQKTADCQTGTALCVEHACVATLACTTSQTCPNGQCDTSTGHCVQCLTSKDCAAAAFCDAQNRCVPDVCQTATCVGLNALTCAGDGGGFTVVSTCDDGLPCTVDSCSLGGCSHVVACEDGNVCSVDACASTGCTHLPSAATCTDGDACTVGDACVQLLCTGSAKDCSDGNACTADTCAPLTGACDVTPWTATACSDGIACTQDICAAGQCQSTPGTCDDGNICTVESCDAKKGCIVSNVFLVDCAGVGDPCVTGSACITGTCIKALLACDDGDPCTLDSCTAGVGCTAHPLANNTACGTGQVCIQQVCTTCAANTADVNADPADGCECAADSHYPGTANGCQSAVSVGIFTENQKTLATVSGNLLPGEAADWYQFVAVDSPESDGGCDGFNVRVRFTANPADAFRFDLHHASCATDLPYCSSATDSSWTTAFAGAPWGPEAAGQTLGGECKCTQTGAGGLPGFGSHCVDDTATYYIRVYRNAGAAVSCAPYTLEVSNGFYPVIGP